MGSTPDRMSRLRCALLLTNGSRLREWNYSLISLHGMMILVVCIRFSSWEMRRSPLLASELFRTGLENASSCVRIAEGLMRPDLRLISPYSPLS